MKTLWNKGDHLDEQIARFTVGDDREIDLSFARQEVIASLAHVLTLLKAELVTTEDAHSLTSVLVDLYQQAQQNQLVIQQQDEDIHSTLERILIERLGSIGKRVHTARSRNDQIATDIALWIRDQALHLQEMVVDIVAILHQFASKYKDQILLGMTHLQPAMPSSVGAWAAGYASLFLEDVLQFQHAYQCANACPLGSAAGYGVPQDLAPIDREFTAQVLGFERALQPVTAVQGGRGKLEASFLFACAQFATTSARLARDLVLYVTPQFNFVQLPIAFTTGSSIMPQKRNPDVMELIRGISPVVQSSLMEVLSLSASVPSGYHRDFQRLKSPLLRGFDLTQQTMMMLKHFLPQLTFNTEAVEQACTKEIDATRRALQLVVQGMPFRDAYQQVAQEVFTDQLPEIEGPRVPQIDQALSQINTRHAQAKQWGMTQQAHQTHCLQELFKHIDSLNVGS